MCCVFEDNCCFSVNIAKKSKIHRVRVVNGAAPSPAPFPPPGGWKAGARRIHAGGVARPAGALNRAGADQGAEALVEMPGDAPSRAAIGAGAQRACADPSPRSGRESAECSKRAGLLVLLFVCVAVVMVVVVVVVGQRQMMVIGACEFARGCRRCMYRLFPSDRVGEKS